MTWLCQYVSFSCNVPNLCSSARTTRQLNKVPFLSYPYLVTLCMMIKWESKTKKRAVQFIWFYAYFVFCSFLPWDLACNFLSLLLAACFDVFEGTDSTVTAFFCPYKRVKVSHRSVSYLKDKRQRQVTCALYLGRCELKSLWKVAFGVRTSILRKPEEKMSKQCHWMKEETKTKIKTKMTTNARLQTAVTVQKEISDIRPYLLRGNKELFR